MINQLFQQYDDKWDGYLYRTGPGGVYYHTSHEGAEYYVDPTMPKRGAPDRYTIPDLQKVLLIDLDHVGPPEGDKIGLQTVADILSMSVDDLLDYDFGIGIEKALPTFAQQGYQAVVIDGQTGMEVAGSPVEVVDLSNSVAVADKFESKLKDKLSRI